MGGGDDNANKGNMRWRWRVGTINTVSTSMCTTMCTTMQHETGRKGGVRVEVGAKHIIRK